MDITAKMVSDLRARTGAGMMECKKALVEAQGNEETAIEILQQKRRGYGQLKKPAATPNRALLKHTFIQTTRSAFS